MSNITKTAMITVCGRPNVGKSSLTNALVGEKVAIVSNKAQTTRIRIYGIVNREDTQYILLDTPGLHKPKSALGDYMVKVVTSSLSDVDCALLLVEPIPHVGGPEKALIDRIREEKIPCILCINKIDTVEPAELLPVIAAYNEVWDGFDAIIPISAHKGGGLDDLMHELQKYAQEGPQLFPDGETTDQPERQVMGELLREKLLLCLDKEIPHGTAVEITKFSERDSGVVDVDATIYCEKASHKGIIIGKGGQEVDKLKEELKKLTGKEVQINIFEVKRPEVDAVIVANNIARQLEGRVSYRRAVKTAIASTMRMGAEGIKIQISGRVGGAEMARSETYKEGRIPLHTFRADVDYALAEAITKVGILGVKVWICTGEVYGKRDLFEISGASSFSGTGEGGRRDDRGPRGKRDGNRKRRGGDRPAR